MSGQAFWFASLAGADIKADGSWNPLQVGGGGMTGDASVATGGPNGLTLNVEAVVQVQFWAEFAAEGSGEQQIGIRLDETGSGQGVAIRGAAQLLPDASMLTAGYDGWLAAGAVINPAALAPSSASARIMPTSYVTIIVTPVATASGGGDGGGVGGSSSGVSPVPSTDGSVLVSCEYNPAQFGPVGTTWAILNDNPLLGWFLNPDPKVKATPAIIGSMPPDPPKTGDVISPLWAHAVGTIVFVPDTFRGTASDFFTFVATNNGAHRPIYAAFSNVTLATAWRGWKESNPDLALDTPPNI